MPVDPSIRIVCNCGPLIALAAVDQLALLPRLFGQVAVPAAVYQELIRGARFEGNARMFQWPWLHVVELPGAIDPFLVSQLDRGEAAVITLAQQMDGATVLMDERRGRRVAEQVFGLSVVGTGGLLLRAKDAGLIFEVTPVLSAMRANGYFLSDRLVQGICRAAGELPGGKADG